jgi:hypothetical protein
MKRLVRLAFWLLLIAVVVACALSRLGGGLPRVVSDLLGRYVTPVVVTATVEGAPTEAAAPTEEPLARAATLAPEPTATREPTATPLPSKVPTPAQPTALVTSDNLNVRSGPSTDYPIVARLARGDEVVILGRNKASTWLQVKLADGKQGWVWAEYTKPSVPLDQVALVTNIPKPPTPAASRTPAPPTATLTVDQQIAKVAKGKHGTLGQPSESGGVSAGGEVEVTIINDTPHALTLLIGSPSSVTIRIDACPVCKEYGLVGPVFCPEEGRTRTTVRLKPGTSQVVARVSDPSVIPFYGTWELKSDTSYFNCFYISSTWR